MCGRTCMQGSMWACRSMTHPYAIAGHIPSHGGELLSFTGHSHLQSNHGLLSSTGHLHAELTTKAYIKLTITQHPEPPHTPSFSQNHCSAPSLQRRRTQTEVNNNTLSMHVTRTAGPHAHTPTICRACRSYLDPPAHAWTHLETLGLQIQNGVLRMLPHGMPFSDRHLPRRCRKRI